MRRYCRLGRAGMMKNENHEHVGVMLIESRHSLQVARPSAFRSFGRSKSVDFRLRLYPIY